MSSDDLTPLADSLRRLRPSPGTLSRDAVMFRAGRASARRGWGWPLATLSSALLALGLGTVLMLRPGPRQVVHVVHVPVERPAAPVPPPVPPQAVVVRPPEPAEVDILPPVPSASLPRYLELQDQVRRWGLHALPPLPPVERPAEAATVKSLLQSL